MDIDLVRRKYRWNAALYDLVRGPTARLRDIAIGRLGLRPGATVLDVGCGTGLSFEPLEEAVGPTGRIVGVDVSPDMLAKAREKITTHGWSNVTLIEANAEDATLEPESVDAVLSFYTHDIVSSERAMRVAVRALRTGGPFVAAGVKLTTGVRGLLLNPLTVGYSLPAVTNLSGLQCPWRELERMLGHLDVEEYAGGTAYVARGAKLSIDELARRTGESSERLQEWRALGLISEPQVESFRQADVERARLVRMFLDRGIALEAIVAWAKNGEMERHVRLLAPRADVKTYTVREAAGRVALSTDLAEHIWEAGGLGRTTDTLIDDDVAALDVIKKALDAGFPADAIEQIARVSTDALGRVADTQARLFHFHIRRGLQARGLSGPAHTEAVWSASERLAPLITPIVAYCHRRALRQAVREAAVLELAEQSGVLGEPELLEQMHAAIVFVDLSSFTALADAMGDLKGAEVLDRFSTLVRQAAKRFDGRVAKQIGDAFMLVFPQPGPAVACAAEIDRQARHEPQFPAVRSGVSWGPVLYRDGDYVGANVNLAARLAAAANRHQLLVSASARHEITSLPEIEFGQLPNRQLKGLVDEVELYEARSTTEIETTPLVDPVCGMELQLGEAVATLRLSGRDVSFCSEECLRRFVATPAQYAGLVIPPSDAGESGHE